MPCSAVRCSASSGVAEIRAEIERQLDTFEKHLGFPPDHIDGHEHVHVLPGIRQSLFEVVSRRYPGAEAAAARSRGPLERDRRPRRGAGQGQGRRGAGLRLR